MSATMNDILAVIMGGGQRGASLSIDEDAFQTGGADGRSISAH